VSEKVDDQGKVDSGCTMQFSGKCIGRAVDGFVASMESVMAGQGRPLVVRVPRETVAKLDLLVQGGLCKSRSEAALYLLERGAESAASTFERISQVNEQIDRMRGDLATWTQASKA
jgi:Arc/MetJ-type ribon-helix-helix transcriptional regulator